MLLAARGSGDANGVGVALGSGGNLRALLDALGATNIPDAVAVSVAGLGVGRIAEFALLGTLHGDAVVLASSVSTARTDGHPAAARSLATLCVGIPGACRRGMAVPFGGHGVASGDASARSGIILAIVVVGATSGVILVLDAALDTASQELRIPRAQILGSFTVNLG